MKAIIQAYSPKEVERIARGEQTIKVCKTAPKDTPFKVYVYCTKKRMTRVPSMYAYLHKNEPRACAEYGTIETWGKIGDVIVNPHLASKHVSFGMHGKVVGSFVCDRVRLCIPFGLKGHLLSQEVYREMCLTKEQLDKYGGLKTLYGWHITKPKLFDKPKELGEFYTICNKYGDDSCGDCPYLAVEQCSFPCDDCVDTWCSVDNIKPITRPPQSWCYVEELQ